MNKYKIEDRVLTTDGDVFTVAVIEYDGVSITYSNMPGGRVYIESNILGKVKDVMLEDD